MKLATLKDGSRDGQLAVVSRDLTQAHFATGVATRLQQVLDDWNFLSPQLEDLYRTLNSGKPRHAFAFEPAQCMAPLPRGGRWVHGAAYPSHRERLGLPSDAEAPLLDGASDHLLGPRDAVHLPVALEPDFEAGVAVVTGDLRAGSSPEQALEAVRLLVLANDFVLRQPGLGAAQHRPATAFGPVAVTPDELGGAWSGGRLQATLEVSWNGRRIGLCDTGETDLHFGQLLARLARWRHLRAGCIVGAGAVSNRDASRGVCSIAEQRAIEQAEHGAPATARLQADDTLRIELKAGNGESLFGAIDHHLVDAA